MKKTISILIGLLIIFSVVGITIFNTYNQEKGETNIVKPNEEDEIQKPDDSQQLVEEETSVEEEQPELTDDEEEIKTIVENFKYIGFKYKDTQKEPLNKADSSNKKGDTSTKKEDTSTKEEISDKEENDNKVPVKPEYISTRNILSIQDDVTESNGVKLTINAGTIKIVGKSSKAITTTPAFKLKIDQKLNGTYTFSTNNIHGHNVYSLMEITDADGNILVKKINLNGHRTYTLSDLDTECLYLNIYITSSVYEYDYEGNFQLEEGENKTQFVPTKINLNEEIPAEHKNNPLWNKTIYSDGDSVANGDGAKGYSYVNFIKDNNNMLLTKESVGGTTLSMRKSRKDSILERVLKMSGDYDYILLEGGFNDMFNTIEIGALTDSYEDNFDTTTVIGSVEKMCYFLNKNYKDSKKLFVLGHKKVDALTIDLQPKYWNAIKVALDKWGIPYVDLREETDLCASTPELADKYFAEPEGSHPNKKAYEKFYVPIIESKLKSL